MDTKRFNTPEYKRQIHAVRTYRRPQNQQPEDPFRKFLAAIGLGSLLRQIIAVLVFAALVYLTYFAKFLMIVPPTVSGADGGAAAQVQSQFAAYEKTFYFIFPQRNILFFSAKRFSAYLAANDYDIAAVTAVRKKLWNHVSIAVNQRISEYQFEAEGNYYIVSSDGHAGTQIAPEQLSQFSQYPLIIDQALEQVTPGAQILTTATLQYMEYMRQNISEKISEQIGHLEIAGISSNDLVVVTSAGTQFYFDDSTDPKIYLDRLFTLWSTLTPAQQQKLAYVDMRFDPKAYGCYKGDPCDSSALPTPTPCPSDVFCALPTPTPSVTPSAAPTPKATPTPSIKPTKK